LDLLIRIEYDLVAFKDKSDRQGETQLALEGLVEFAPMEAGADNVQFRLGERTLHSQYKSIVELGRIVATILVDHERAGDGAEFQEAMPILVRSRQPRRFQGKDRANPAHRYFADQRFEVFPVGRRTPGLTEIPVEDADLLPLPAERLGFALQIVLSLRALLIEADLPHCRLADVNASVPRQVAIGNLRVRHHRPPPD
jgi:hypothetical protein